MLRDGEAALDVVQEFALALSRRASFRAEGTLEAWLWHRPQPCATGSARGSTQMRMTLVPTATDRRSYAATVVICETEVPLEIGVNPIWYDDRDTGQRRINGSTLLVAERGTRRLFASAVLRTDRTRAETGPLTTGTAASAPPKPADQRNNNDQAAAAGAGTMRVWSRRCFTSSAHAVAAGRSSSNRSSSARRRQSASVGRYIAGATGTSSRNIRTCCPGVLRVARTRGSLRGREQLPGPGPS